MQKKKKAPGINWHALFGGAHPIKNLAGLSATGLDLLEKDFEYIAIAGGSYPERVMRYAIDGEDEDILPELEMLDLYFKSRHFAPRLREKRSREKLFEESSVGVHDFLERLGKIYHALMNPLNPNFLLPARFHSPSWLEALLLHASGSYSGDMQTYLQLKLIERFIVATGEGKEALVKIIFLTLSFDYSSCEMVSIFFSLIDLPSIVSENPRYIEEALGSTNNGIVIQALMVIRSFGIAPAQFGRSIVRLALSNTTVIRKAAQRVIRSSRETFNVPMKEEIQNAPQQEKLRGVRIFGRLYGSEDSLFLRELLERETSGDIKKAICHILDLYSMQTNKPHDAHTT